MVMENDLTHPNKTEEEVLVSVEIPLEFVRAADFKMYFCNSIQISPGKSELQWFFGQIIAPPASSTKPEKLFCEQMFGVAISLDQAKRVFELLQRQLDALEKRQTKDSKDTQ
jgi:hypothetical protein